MAAEWTNWSGSLRFKPGRIEEPEDEDALANLIRSASSEGRTVRIGGSGHSSTALLETDSVLVSLKKLTENQKKLIEKVSESQAWAPAGISLRNLGEALLQAGLATPNLGDVSVQTVSGAISVGTHGTGKQLPVLSAMLSGVRLVNGRGQIVESTEDADPDFLRAVRVSLGSFGIFTRVRLNLLPAFKLRRREWCTHIDDCLSHLNELIDGNRNFDFYWYPRSDLAKLRTWNPPGEGMDDVPFAKNVEDRTAWSFDALTKQRVLKFDEMEYFLPSGAGPSCFQEVRRRMKEKHRKYVGWRVLYRTIAPDDSYLSPAFQQQSVTISLHQNNTLPFEEFFKDIEPIFLAYNGRPHWAKKHSLKADKLRTLYPMWDNFLNTRRRLDPQGVFLNSYLKDLFGV